MAKSEYEQVWEEEWVELPRKLHLQCCSCGLVHRIQFKVAKKTLLAKFTVDLRKTAAVRREKRKQEQQDGD